nr:nascent polypeptide-associated complex subunit alpha, muscle-specific form isoform X3 [Halyomorpha halys]
MRLLITVVCCLIVIHGTSSVPGFRQKLANSFLAQALGQGNSLKNQVVKDNEETEYPVITNINVQDIIENSDNNAVHKDTRPALPTEENSNYSALSRETSNNGEIGPGINDVVQSRIKRQVAKSPRRRVKTYRYVSQPPRSRFSYIQQIQHLFTPKPVATPQIQTKHKTIVVENHTDHEEHHSEEIEEHHTTTTSELKMTKKKRKTKRKPGSQGTTDNAEDYEDEQSIEEENGETEDLTINNDSSNVIATGGKTKNSKSQSTTGVKPNISNIVMAVRNETQASLDKKGTESRNPHSVGITKAKTEKTAGVSRSSNTDLGHKEKATTLDSPSSVSVPTVINVQKSDTQNGNLPDLQSDKKLSLKNLPTDGKNLKSFFKNVLGLRGNQSPERATIEIRNHNPVSKGSSSARNISTVINNLFDNNIGKNNIKTGNIESISKFPNAANTLKTFIKQQIAAPSQPSRAKLTFRFRTPKQKSVSSPMNLLYNKDLAKSEEENTEINHNIELDNRDNAFKAPKEQDGLSSVPKVLVKDTTVPKLIQTTTNQPNVVPSQPSVIREPKPTGGITSAPKQSGNNPAVPRSPRTISDQPPLTASQPSLVVENLPSVPNVPSVSANIPNIEKLKTITNSPSVSTPQSSTISEVPKFRRPKSKTITTTHDVLYDEDIVESEEENTDINHNVEVDKSSTVFNVPKIVGRLPSVPKVPTLSPNLPSSPKLTTKVQNSPRVPSLQPSKIRVPKFRTPKSKTILTSHDVLYDEDEIESEEENTDINNNVEVDKSSTVFNVPKIVGRLPSVPEVTIVSPNLPSSPKSTTTIQNFPSVPSSQPSKIRVPKFRRPKSKTITTSHDVLYDEDVIESEEENTEIRKNAEFDKSGTIFNGPKTLGNPRSIPTALTVSPNVSTPPKSTTTTQNPPSNPSSQPSKVRVPKFRRPKSKTITTSHDVLYDEDVIESEEENTDINHNVEVDKSGTVFNVPKIVGRLPSVPKVPTVSPNVSTPPKSTTAIQNPPSDPSSQPSKVRVPKFRRPNSKTITNSHDVLYDEDVIESEEENTEIKKIAEFDKSGTIENGPKTLGNPRSIPTVPTVSPNVSNPPKSTKTTQNPPSDPSSQSSKIRVPKFRRPKSKTITTSHDVLYDEDVIESEEENTEINDNIEIDESGRVLNVPKIGAVPNISSNIPNVPSPIKKISKLSKYLPDFLTSPPSSSPDAPQKTSGKLPVTPISPRPSENEPTNPSTKYSGTKITKPQKSKNEAVPTSKIGFNDTEEPNSEEDNPEKNNDHTKTDFQIPKVLKNLPNIANAFKLPGKLPNIPGLPAGFRNWPIFSPSQTSSNRIPNLKRPETKGVPTSTIGSSDTEEPNIEYQTDIDNANDMDNPSAPKPVGNNAGIPRSPRTSENEPVNTSSQPSGMTISKPQKPKTNTVPTKLNSKDVTSPTFGNWPFFTSSQTSPIRMPNFRKPKTKAVPTSNTGSKDTEEPHSEDVDSENNSETDSNTETDFQIPKVLKNLPNIANALKLPGKLPNIPGLPAGFRNWPFFSPSQTSSNRIPNLKRPETKGVPASTIGSINTEEPNLEGDQTEINNENDVDNSNVHKPVSNNAGIPRSPRTSEKEPINTTSQRSVSKIPKPQNPKSNTVPASMNSGIISSPTAFGICPFFTPPQTSPIQNPNSKKPKMNALPISKIGSQDTEEPHSQDDDSENNSETDSNTETNFQIPKVLKNLPNIANALKVPSKLPNIPSVSTGFGNWPFFPPSQTSPIRMPKQKRPENKGVPISSETDEPNFAEDQNENELDNPSTSKPVGSIPRSPRTSENEPAKTPSQPSVNKLPFFNLPKTGGKLHSVPNGPAETDNLPAVTKPPTFGNWPFFSPPQTSPAESPKFRTPKNKIPSLTPENFSEHDNFNEDEYGPEDHDSAENIFKKPKTGGKLPSVPKGPATINNLRPVTKPPTTFGNWPFFSPPQTSPARFPKLRTPKSKIPSLSPENFSEDDNFNEDEYGPEDHDSAERFLKKPKTGGKLPSVPKRPATTDNLPAVTKPPTTFGNWPFFSPPQTSPAKFPKFRTPKNKIPSLSPENFSEHDNFNEDEYGPEDHDSAENIFKKPKTGGKLPSVPKGPATTDNLRGVTKPPTTFGNWPFFSPPQTSPARFPKFRTPKSKTVPSFQNIINYSENINPERYDPDVKDDTESFFNLPQSDKTSGVGRSPGIPGNQPSILTSQPSVMRVPKLRRPKNQAVQPPQKMFHNPHQFIPDNLIDHDTEIDYAEDNFPKSVGNRPFVPALSTKNSPYLSRTPMKYGNWPIISPAQVSIGPFPKLRRPKIKTLKPSRVQYAGIPTSAIYDTGNIFNVPERVERLVSTGFPYGKSPPNYNLYNTNYISSTPAIIRHVQPIPKVSKSFYIAHTPNVPMVVSNIIPAPKVSLITGSLRKVPMIIENRPHLVVASPTYSAMKFPALKNSKSWGVEPAPKIPQGTYNINSKPFNSFLRNISPVPKISGVRKSRVLPNPTSPTINARKARSGLSKNRYSPSPEKKKKVLDMEAFSTGITDNIHLQMDEHESLDMIALEKRAGKTIWGIPLSNAAGKIEYLTMGNQEGDMKFTSSTDRFGRIEYLYPIRDDTGHSHNLHLKTTGGHLPLVESDYNDGQHSTGFIGYDETGEYIVPIHFESNNRLVIDPYAHSLRYAVDVHPAYEIVEEVFYYKK